MSSFVEALGKPDNRLEVDRFMSGDVDFKEKNGELLIAALQYYPRIVDSYISTGDYKQYISDGDRVRDFVSALYEQARRTGDASLLVQAIRYDNRDKKHSVSYMLAFRRAVVDNEIDVAESIYREIGYPPDLVADLLQIDSPAIFSNVANRKPEEWNAYLEVMRDLRTRSKDTFFQDYIAYRIINYASPHELLTNLMAADNPEYLWLVEDLPAPVLARYVMWKYSAQSASENKSTGFEELTAVLGRLPQHELETRDMLYEYLVLVASTRSQDPNVLKNIEETKKRRWPNYQEEARKHDLSKIREVIAGTKLENIVSQKDVDASIIDPILVLFKNKDINMKELVRMVRDIIKGRFRYLPG